MTIVLFLIYSLEAYTKVHPTDEPKTVTKKQLIVETRLVS